MCYDVYTMFYLAEQAAQCDTASVVLFAYMFVHVLVDAVGSYTRKSLQIKLPLTRPFTTAIHMPPITVFKSFNLQQDIVLPPISNIIT